MVHDYVILRMLQGIDERSVLGTNTTDMVSAPPMPS
jgi:hypothetical protein